MYAARSLVEEEASRLVNRQVVARYPASCNPLPAHLAVPCNLLGQWSRLLHCTARQADPHYGFHNQRPMLTLGLPELFSDSCLEASNWLPSSFLGVCLGTSHREPSWCLHANYRASCLLGHQLLVSFLIVLQWPTVAVHLLDSVALWLDLVGCNAQKGRGCTHDEGMHGHHDHFFGGVSPHIVQRSNMWHLSPSISNGHCAFDIFLFLGRLAEADCSHHY